MTTDPRRQAIEAALEAVTEGWAELPETGLNGKGIRRSIMTRAIDAYEVVMRDAFKQSMRKGGNLYRPPPHQIQLQDRGAVHWATLPQDPETKP